MRLDVRLIVPGPDAGTILLDDQGCLPRVAADGDADEGSVVAIDDALRSELGLVVPILESYPRWDTAGDGDVVPTLATTEAPSRSWKPPNGLFFGQLPDAIVGVADPLQPRAADWLSQLRTGAAPPPLRPRWSRPRWMGRAGAWMASAAFAAGRPLVGEPRPFYLRGISALLRAPTEDGDLYLKAVFPPFHAEPAITRWLAGHAPGSVPDVLGIDEDEGWLLMADVDGTLVGELAGADRPAGLAAGARTIVALQQSIAGEVERLAALGAPRRPLDEVPLLLDGALGPDGLSIRNTKITTKRRRRAVATVTTAIDRVSDLGFPDTIVHGDFHPGNAFVGREAVVIIDWSDAAVGNPLVDLATWVAWSQDHPAENEVALDAWVDAWSETVDARVLRRRVDDILIVGDAYQVISYDGIIRALEPAMRYTMGTGGGSWLERLEQVASAS